MAGKFSLLSALFYFSSLSSFAQKNLKEAVVIFNNADTTKGFVDYGEWLSNPSSVLFTPDRSTASKRFGVNELSYFEVMGLGQYKRYTVRVSLDDEVVSSFSNKDTSSATRTVFLKIIQKGKNITLFSYRDDLKRRLYILTDGETVPMELLNSVYMMDGQVKEEKQYRSRLLGAASKYLPGNGDIISRINNAGYYVDAIEDICLTLNGIDKITVAARSKTYSRPGWRLFAGGGINRGALKMSGSNMFTGKNSYPFYTPVADIGADLVINPAAGKLVFRGQLQITSYKTDGYNFVDYTQYTDQYTFTFRQVNIAFEPQLLYNIYNKKNLKWFLSAGVGFNFSRYPVNDLKFLRTSSTNSDAENNNYLPFTRGFWMNACFTTGIDISRMELSFLFYPSTSVTQTQAYGLSNTSLQLRLNYYIKK